MKIRLLALLGSLTLLAISAFFILSPRSKQGSLPNPAGARMISKEIPKPLAIDGSPLEAPPASEGRPASPPKVKQAFDRPLEATKDIVTWFPNAGLISSTQVDHGNRRFTRVRIYKANFKYPLLRIVDSWIGNPDDKQATLVSQEAMVADHLIVKPKDGIGDAELQAALERSGGTIRRRLPQSGLYLIAIPVHDADSFTDTANKLSKETAAISYAEPDYIAHATLTPNDFGYGAQWEYDNQGAIGVLDADIDGPEAWALCTGSRSVLVGVVDSGIQLNHRDLVNNIWVNPGEISGNGIDDDGNGYIDDIHGWDFANEDNNPGDDYGHGTATSGILGAEGNNGLDHAGVCWQVSILPLKFLNSSGSGTISDAVEATFYSTHLGVKILSNSWNGGGPSQSMLDAIVAADAANVLYIAASGNAGTNNDTTPNYPCGFEVPNVISVAASNWDDNLAGFSNYGLTSVDLAAPGDRIWVLWNNGSITLSSGTSISAPMVSGAAALLWTYRPGLSHRLVKDILLSSTDQIPGLAGKVQTAGRLNLDNALRTGIAVTLPGQITFRGVRGEALEPGQLTFSIAHAYGSNTGWRITAAQPLLDFSATSGSLAPNSYQNLTVSPSATAVSLPPGDYDVPVTFEETTSGTSTTRTFHLTVLDPLQIQPSTGLSSGGHPGGPFSPSSATYQLQNISTQTLDWSATLAGPAPWADLSSSSGTLSPSQSVDLTVTINSLASGLPLGTHHLDLTITDETSAYQRILPIDLTIGPDYFTRNFATSSFDLAYQTITFVPVAGSEHYRVTREPALAFPVDPAGGTSCGFELGGNPAPVSIPLGGNQVTFFGTGYSSIYMNYIGTLTFGAPGSASYSPDLSDHFNRPEVSAIHGALSPYLGGSSTWKVLPDRVVATSLNLPSISSDGNNSFQIEVWFDGKIRITYLGISYPNPLLGLSSGQGLPADYYPSDFSAYPTAGSIASQPQDLHIRTGHDGTLRVAMAGDGPFTYQWRHNGQPIEDATEASFVIHDAQASDAGPYDVVVDTPEGPLTSRTALLNVSDSNLANGSFENGLGDWTTAGNVSIQSGPPYPSSDGANLVAFNAVNSQPTGVITQTFATKPGTLYLLDFNLGILGFIAAEQRLNTRVTGGSVLLDVTDPISTTSVNHTKWLAKHYEFTADDVLTTLTFRDVSPGTASVDLLLDHVRLTAVYQLDVNTAPPVSLHVTVSPPDRQSLGDAEYVPFTRHYVEGTSVELSVPATADGKSFVRWMVNGESHSTDPAVSIPIDRPVSMTAVYSTAFDVNLNPADEARTFVYTGPFNRLAWSAYFWNQSGASMDWSAAAETAVGSGDPLFFKVIPSHGTVTDGGVIQFAVMLTEPARYLPAGRHVGRVVVNSPQLGQTEQEIVLNVIDPEAYLSNPGFEAGPAVWTQQGNVAIKSSPEYTPSLGFKLAVFNSVNSTPNGVLTQPILTEPGVTYQIAFDIGVLAFNTQAQRLQVEAVDMANPTTPFFSQTVTKNGIADGQSHWQRVSFSFTAPGENIEIRFKDISSATNAIDLLLDNITLRNPYFTIPVSTLADENDPSPGMGGGESLREAISQAAAIPGAHNLALSSGMQGGTIPLTHGSLHITSPIAINSLTDSITITANGLSRVIRSDAHTALLNINLVQGNAATDTDLPSGGAIVGGSTLVLTNVQVSGSNAPAAGGGLMAMGDTLASRCRFIGNEASIGGGVHTTWRILLENCLISNNHAAANGGGLSAASGLGSGYMLLSDSTVSNNTSGNHGGGYCGSAGYKTSGNFFAENSTFSGNETVTAGGAIYCNGSVRLEHTTVANNLCTSPSSDGGGIANGTPIIGNSLLSENTAFTNPDIHPSNIIAFAANRIGPGAKLAPLGDYGGLTPTMPPLPGSPVIDAGIALTGAATHDQRRWARPLGIQPDLGSTEAYPTFSPPAVDTDSDGIDDRLEPIYQLTVGTDDSMQDTDGDGSPDSEEIAGMTDPNDPNSLLRILSFAPLSPPNLFRVTFSSYPGLSYTLECDQDLDFHGPNAREHPLGPAISTTGQTDVDLLPGRDFVRIRRNF